MAEISPGKVYFIGAGPGDPELITIKGEKRIAAAGLILYAGSLVPKEILRAARSNAEIHDTVRMPLDRQIDLMANAAWEGKAVARVHTGDPSIFGAIHEQMRGLRARNVAFEVVPGVSSVFAAAAALNLEFTLPELTQTLILTRVSGRTRVPEKERLRDLARHRASLAIFLSASLLPQVVSELAEAGYAADTAVAVVYRASWPDQIAVRATLGTIEAEAGRAGLTNQSLIIVSPGLDKQPAPTVSHLYGAYQDRERTRSGHAIFALTEPAIAFARKLLNELPNAALFVPETLIKDDSDAEKMIAIRNGVRDALQNEFLRAESLICIMASGIVVRSIAPLLTNKHRDPAVIVSDPQGKFIVSLLGGHEGGANALAQRIARFSGGQAVVTTASDNRNIPALDVLAQDHRWTIHPQSDLAAVMAALVNETPATLLHDPDLEPPDALRTIGWETVHPLSESDRDLKTPTVIFTYRAFGSLRIENMKRIAVIRPRILCVGVGCNRGTAAAEILDAISEVFNDEKLSFESIREIASIEAKADEKGLIELARSRDWKIRFFNRTEIESVSNLIQPSAAALKALGVSGVAEPSALLSAQSRKLRVRKRKFANVTVAVAVYQEKS